MGTRHDLNESMLMFAEIVNDAVGSNPQVTYYIDPAYGMSKHLT